MTLSHPPRARRPTQWQVGANIHVITHYPNAIPSLGPNLGGHNAGATASFVLDDLIIVLESDPSHVGSVHRGVGTGAPDAPERAMAVIRDFIVH